MLGWMEKRFKISKNQISKIIDRTSLIDWFL